MESNYQNIFGNVKSDHSAYTCSVCFQEFFSYNDLAIHERLHIEQMSLASLQTHLLPQFDNRATGLSSNLQTSLRPQVDSHSIGIATTVQPVLSQTLEKRPSSVVTSLPSSSRSQLEVSRTSAFHSSAAYIKRTDSPIPEPHIPRTHTELKTPAYGLLPSYEREFHPAKRVERNKSTDSRASPYDPGIRSEKLSDSSTSLGSVSIIRPHAHKSPPLYEIPGTSAEKNVISTRSDLGISGFIQSDPRSTLYDLASSEKNIPVSHLENPYQKHHAETISLYPENLHLDGYGKRQSLSAPTVIPITVADYSRQSLSRHDDYQVSNIQYQTPVSTVRTNSQYSLERQHITQSSATDMSLSNQYHKKQNEEAATIPTAPQTAYSGIPSYVQAALNYSQLNPMGSTLFKPDQFHSAPQVYQRFDSHNHLPHETLEKVYPENYSQNHYQVQSVPICSGVTTTSAVEPPKTVYYSEPSSSNIPVTSAVTSPAVVGGSGYANKPPNAIVLPDGTYYPSGLPVPELPVESMETKTNNVGVDTSYTADNKVNVVKKVDEELSKKQEFVDMIKKLQGDRKFHKKVGLASEGSDGESSESSYEYKVDIDCFICSEEFETEKGLYKHLQKHRKSGELSPVEESDDDGERIAKKVCKYCGRQFMQVSRLIEHIRKHTGEKPYECRFCDKGYAMKNRYIKHEASHNIEEDGICCELCDCKLENKANYLYHLHEHLLDEDKKKAEEKQQEYADMIRSMQLVKGGEKDKADDSENQMLNSLLDFEKEQKRKKADQDAENKTPETAMCRICPQTILKKDFLKHFKSHKVYICHECKRGFTSKQNYKYHSDTLHLKEEKSKTVPIKRTFICTICEKIFAKKNKFKHHVEIHVDDPVIRCEVCDRPFYNKGDYIYHLNLHEIDDLAKLERERQNALKSVSKKGLKFKISTKKAKKQDRVSGSSETESPSNRSLRQRDKKQSTSDHTVQEHTEEPSRKELRHRDKRKLVDNESGDPDQQSKRPRKEVDRFMETHSGAKTFLKKLRKRKPVNYGDGDEENNDEEGSDDEKVQDISNPTNQDDDTDTLEEDTVRKISVPTENTPPELVDCRVCKRQIPKLVFIKHFKTHSFLTCDNCERSFIRKNSFITHMKNIHQKEVSEEFFEENFPKFCETKSHKHKVKSEEKQKLVDLKEHEQTKEKEVNKKFQNSVNIQGSAGFEVNKVEQDEDSPGYQIGIDTENPFICILCGKRFNSKSSVVNHVKVHFNVDKNITDGTCHENSVDKKIGSPLKYIEQSVEKLDSSQSKIQRKDQSYYCDICDRTIFRRQNYESHMKAKHKVTEDSKPPETEQTKISSAESKLQLGVDVRSPPKKRKIFVDEALQESIGTSYINSSINPNVSTVFNKPNMDSNNDSRQNNTSLSIDSGSFHSTKEKLAKTNEKSKAGLGQTACLGEQNVARNKFAKTFPKFCPVCHRRQTSFRDFTEHYRIHTGVKPYKCDFCQQAFTRERNWNAHMKVCPFKSGKHKQEEKQVLDKNSKAVKCKPKVFDRHSKGFKRKTSSLRYSTRLRISNDRDKSQDSVLSKKESSITTASLRQRKEHLKNQNKDSSKTLGKKCPVCFIKVSKDTFNAHLKSHSANINSYSCRFCDKCFKSKRQLYDHRKTHTVEKQPAGSTDSSSEESEQESPPRKTCTFIHKPGSKSYKKARKEAELMDLVCQLCNANFMTREAFETHLQLHEEDEYEESESESESEHCESTEQTNDNIESEDECDKVSLISPERIKESESKSLLSNTDTACEGNEPVDTSLVESSLVEKEKRDHKIIADHETGNDSKVRSDQELTLKNKVNMVSRTDNESVSAENLKLAVDNLQDSKTEILKVHNAVNHVGVESREAKEKSIFSTVTDLILSNSGCLEKTNSKMVSVNAASQSQENTKAVTELGHNHKVDSEYHFRQKEQEYSNGCKTDSFHKTEKYIKPTQFDNLENNRTIRTDSDAVKYKDTFPVGNNLNNYPSVSQINTRNVEKSEPLDHSESVESCDIGNERDPQSPRSFKSQNLTRMSPESAQAKWKLKVESVLISQLELNENRKQNVNKLENLENRDHADKTETSSEVHPGNIEKYECRLCGDIFDISDDFKRHMTAHLNESPPYCELCDIYFMAIYPKRRLLEHNRKKHSDDKDSLKDLRT